MNNKHHVGRQVSSLEFYDEIGPVTGVALVLDDENEILVGDDTGYRMEIFCPYGTEQMAGNILASVYGHTYKGFRATDAVLSPDAELGDGVTVGGEYTLLAYRGIDFGPGHMAEIAAPGESTLEHEYQYKTPSQRQTDRKIAQTNSKISKTAEKIRLEVFGEEGPGDTSLRSEIAVELGKITAEVFTEDGGSRIEQTISEIALSVSSDENGSTISLTSGGVTVTSEAIDLHVKAANVTGELTAATIKANKITGGELDFDKVTAKNLTISKLGSISFGDLDGALQEEIDDAWWMAYYAEQDAADAAETVSGWRYGSTTYIDGEMLMTGTVKASSLMGGSVSLLDADGEAAGVITLSAAATEGVGYAVDIESYAAMRLLANVGGIYIKSGYNSFIMLNKGEIQLANGNVRPSPAGAYSSGTASFYWADVYSENALIEVSDRNKKTDIVYGLDGYDAVFDGLQPVSFLFKDGTSGRRHPGLIAQDVEELLIALEIDTKDFSPFVKAPRKDNDGNVVEGEYEYALRYGEFIALLIEQVQKLKKRVTALEGTS